VLKWRKRGASDCLDRSARPQPAAVESNHEERAIVCTLRQAINFPLNDLTFVVCHFLPHLNRDSVWRIQGRGPEPQAKARHRQAHQGPGHIP
jgi:hypothetical protein